MKTLLALLFLLFAQASLDAKDWSIDQLTLRALVQPDGTIEFREARTYRFEGSYSRAEYEIRKQGFDRLYDIDVWMDGVLSFSDEVPDLETDLQDYIIVHELLHLWVPNHGKLWKSVTQAHLGEYQQLEARLKERVGEKKLIQSCNI